MDVDVHALTFNELHVRLRIMFIQNKRKRAPSQIVDFQRASRKRKNSFATCLLSREIVQFARYSVYIYIHL